MCLRWNQGTERGWKPRVEVPGPGEWSPTVRTRRGVSFIRNLEAEPATRMLHNRSVRMCSREQKSKGSRTGQVKSAKDRYGLSRPLASA